MKKVINKVAVRIDKIVGNVWTRKDDWDGLDVWNMRMAKSTWLCYDRFNSKCVSWLM